MDGRDKGRVRINIGNNAEITTVFSLLATPPALSLFCPNIQGRKPTEVLVGLCGSAAPSAELVRLKGLKHHQQYDAKQEKNRNLVEEAIEDMAMLVCIFVDGMHVTAALEVVDHQEGDTRQL